MSSAGFPFLTVLVLVPAIGAAVVALVPVKAVTRWFHEAAGLAVALAVLGLSIAVAVEFKTGDGGYQLVSDHIWAQQLGIHWSLGIDGISLFLVLLTAVLFPLAMLGARVASRPAFVRGVAAAARGGLPRQLRLPRPGVLLPLLRADPGARLLHHRRVGIRPPGLCRHQVLRLHLHRLGLPVGRHPGHRLPPPVADRGAHLRAARPHAHPPVGHRGRPPLSRLHRRLRRQGADLPVPHLVAGRLRRGAQRRRRPAGCGDGQARHLRDGPVRPQPVPAGHQDPGAAAAHPGGDRDPLRRAGGLCPARPEAPAGLLLAGSDRLHRDRHLRPQHPGA